MSHRTAMAIHEKLRGGLNFIHDYFSYIDQSHMCDKIITTCLTDKLVECFFGIVTERCAGNNPTFIEFARALGRDAFFYLLSITSSTQTPGLSIRRTRDERPEKYSYSTVDFKETDLVWEFFRIRHEELFTVNQLSKARKQRKDGKVSKETKSAMMYIRKSDSCVPYIDLVPDSDPSNESKSSLRAVGLAMKSRPMKSIRDFQKQKHGTAPSVLGIQGERRTINLSDCTIQELQNHQMDEQSEHENDDTPILCSNNESSQDEMITPMFNAGDIVVFRGTDRLQFELLEIKSDVYEENLTATTKIMANVLILRDCNEKRVLFFKDPKWAGGSMMFKYILRDKNNDLVMVNMTKFVDTEGTFFQMDTVTYHQLLEIAEEYEVSVQKRSHKRKRVPYVIEQFSDESESDAENEENTVTYPDRRQKKTRANKLQDVLQWAKWWCWSKYLLQQKRQPVQIWKE